MKSSPSGGDANRRHTHSISKHFWPQFLILQNAKTPEKNLEEGPPRYTVSLLRAFLLTQASTLHVLELWIAGLHKLNTDVTPQTIPQFPVPRLERLHTFEITRSEYDLFELESEGQGDGGSSFADTFPHLSRFVYNYHPDLTKHVWNLERDLARIALHPSVNFMELRLDAVTRHSSSSSRLLSPVPLHWS